MNLVFPHESMIPWELSSFILREDILKYWIADKKILQRSLGCQAGITTCAIAADGNVFGCEQLMNFPEMVSGNINDESFEKIWREGSAFRILRSVNIEDLDGECANCGNLGCGGGCRAVAYGHSHNICASYKLCKEFQK